MSPSGLCDLVCTSLSVKDVVDVPHEYRCVLQLLREADQSGLWPPNSTGRTEVIGQTAHAAGGSSFSVGSMPPPLRRPAANTIFPKLMAAAFKVGCYPKRHDRLVLYWVGCMHQPCKIRFQNFHRVFLSASVRESIHRDMVHA